MKTYKPLATLKFFVLGLFLLPIESFAQGGGGGGPRRDPSEFVAIEKQIILDSLAGLNEDQKIIIEEIYKDYEKSITTIRANADPDNREAMRTNMTAIRDGKNESLKAILTEEQYQQFDAIMKARRENMGQQRQTLPLSNGVDLGLHPNCESALQDAKTHYSNVDGCIHCVPTCHTS